jgi:hypothetical protein
MALGTTEETQDMGSESGKSGKEGEGSVKAVADYGRRRSHHVTDVYDAVIGIFRKKRSTTESYPRLELGE